MSKIQWKRLLVVLSRLEKNSVRVVFLFFSSWDPFTFRLTRFIFHPYQKIYAYVYYFPVCLCCIGLADEFTSIFLSIILSRVFWMLYSNAALPKQACDL